VATSEGKRTTEKDLSGPARLALKLGSGAHAGVYRATGGKLFGRMGKSPILLLNTVGRKSGKKRTSPLLYAMDGEDFIIIASKGGAATHPAWYLNLKANPEATVEIGDREVRVEAEVADPEDKARLWQKMVEMYPAYDDYQRKTER
jgi:F420H(2)-dependent quinone reductase